MGQIKKGDLKKSISVKNRQAYFHYAIEDTFVTGMVLQGTEIKSIRQGRVSFTDGYCFIRNGEIYAKGIHVSPYKQASFTNHDPDRVKKLLLQKKEIQKLEKKVEEKGYTIVPLKLFISDNGFAKLEIGIGKGKKLHDKRDSLKEKDQKREMRNL